MAVKTVAPLVDMKVMKKVGWKEDSKAEQKAGRTEPC